jgi:PAS domain-containing protein
MAINLNFEQILGPDPASTMADFSETLTIISHRVQLSGNFAIALIVAFITMIIIACKRFAYLLSAQSQSCQRVQNRLAQDQSTHFLTALLDRSRSRLVVLGTELDFGDGQLLYQQCAAGPDATPIAEAVRTLEKTGQSFEITTRATDGRIVNLRGLPVGHRAVLYIEEKDATDRDIPFRKILDDLPAPVWVRSKHLSLCWGNQAFLAAVGSKTLQGAMAANATLDPSEVDLVATILDSQSSNEVKRFAAVCSQQRTLAISLLPLPGPSVAGIAMDTSELTKAHTKIRLAADIHADVLERLPFCVATFDENQRLTQYNKKYAQFWALSGAWLDTHPSYGDILGHLREQRKLPERRDFAAWKRDQLQPFHKVGTGNEDFWHLPGGKSVCVTTQPLLQGGILMILEEITERLRLESALGLLTQVQKATLDTLDEGIAIFGSDGRLVLHNAHFSALWNLSDKELSSEPHVTRIAALCTARTGPDEIWATVTASVNSMEQERRGKWIKATRADGRTVSLCSSRLPNGATVVTFVDLTDLERFEALGREESQDSASARNKANQPL